MPKTPTQWTPSTKTPTGWANNDIKTPTSFVNADVKNPTSFQPPLVTKTPYLYTSHAYLYTDSTRGYTYLKPSGNTINDKNPTQFANADVKTPTAWSPT